MFEVLSSDGLGASSKGILVISQVSAQNDKMFVSGGKNNI